ncbi:MAG TPA: Rieske (2Fe-2S) protein [Pseudonocardiaceae bacterium]|jgi:cytochrome b6-f complex iron-sulfur subunit|nr:Rieske (2Fe-2S) protein [Pseudonocardiaceae bacterium]
MSRVQRFVEKILRQQRIGRARVEQEADPELRTAILLRSARLGAGTVREEFVTSLHQRLAAELSEDTTPTTVITTRRRRFVQLTATAAASVGLGVAADHLVTGGAVAANPPPGGNDPQLAPDHGVWQTVADSSAMPEGRVLRFDLGTVTGFLRRANGKVAAVSGACTHLGCQLNLAPSRTQLNCPCHGASFAVTGAVLNHRLPITLPPLPEFEVREIDGVIQVLAPKES